MSALRNNGRFWNSVGLGLSVLSVILAAVSFGLPYWVSFQETVFISGIDSSQHVTWNYYYGFWWYCNHMVSESMTPHLCGAVATHTVWERMVICLLLMSIILSGNAAVNSIFYLTCKRDVKLCLYVSLTSAVLSGVTILIGVIMYGSQDKTIVSANVTYHVTTTNLDSAFWLAVTCCVCIIMASLIFLIALFRHVENTVANSESETSIVTSDTYINHLEGDTKKSIELWKDTTKDKEIIQELPTGVAAFPIDDYVDEHAKSKKRSQIEVFKSPTEFNASATKHVEGVHNYESRVPSSQKESTSRSSTSHSCSEADIEVANNFSCSDDGIVTQNYNIDFNNTCICADHLEEHTDINSPVVSSISPQITDHTSIAQQGISKVETTKKIGEACCANKLPKRYRSKSAFAVRGKRGAIDIWTKRHVRKNYSDHLRRYAWTGLPPVERFIDAFACDTPIRKPRNSQTPAGIFVASSDYDIHVCPRQYPHCLSDISAVGNPPDDTQSERWRLKVTTTHTVDGNGGLLRANTELTSADTSREKRFQELIKNETRCQEPSQKSTHSKFVPEILNEPTFASEPPGGTGYDVPFSKHKHVNEVPQQLPPVQSNTMKRRMGRRERRPDYVSYVHKRNARKLKSNAASTYNGENNKRGSEAISETTEITIDRLYKPWI